MEIMQRLLLISTLILVISNSTDAQQPIRAIQDNTNVESQLLNDMKTEVSSYNENNECGTTIMAIEMFAKHPQLLMNQVANEESIRAVISSGANQMSVNIKRIPVVFHIIHENGSENISQAQIYDGIDALNEFYRKIPGSPGDGAGVDADFEFFLARKDENGQCHSGINRIYSALTVHQIAEQPALKGLIQWDPTRYLNIWSVKSINGGLVNGYSTLPVTLNILPVADGIVLKHSKIGTFGTGTGSTTIAHEAGHWLGLFHTFQGGCGGNTPGTCNMGGDLVCDTPPLASATDGCPSGSNTCFETPVDNNDEVRNYMDYSDCRDMFSQGQKDRMHASVEILRSNLYSEANIALAGFGGCFPLAPPVANFVASDTIIYAGTSINFTDITSHIPTTWSWTFDGALTTSSSNQNPSSIEYNNPGTYNVTLYVNGSSSLIKSEYITVLPTPPCESIWNVGDSDPSAAYQIPTTPPQNPGDNGYISGHNAYGDLSKADFFDQYAPYTHVVGARIRFGHAFSSNPLTDKIKVVMWNATGIGGSPGNILGTPKDLLIGDITEFTEIMFDNPIPISGNFYLGVDLEFTSSLTKMIAISTSQLTMVPYGEGRGWTQINNGSWMTYAQIYGQDVNHWIEPIITSNPPIASFTETITDGCEGEHSVTFNASGSSDVVSYNWTFPGGTIGSSTEVNPTISYNSAGSYDVTLLSNGGCNSVSTLTKTNLINVYNTPSFTVTPAATVITQGQSTTANISGPHTYSWEPMAGVTFVDNNNVTLDPDTTTTYVITGLSTDGCMSTKQITITVDSVTGSYEILEEGSFSPYYNSNAQELILSIDANVSEQLDFVLLNYHGQLIKRQEIYVDKGVNAVRVKLNDISNGAYLFRLTSQNGYMVNKLLINN